MIAANDGHWALLTLSDDDLLVALGLASAAGITMAAALLLSNSVVRHRVAPAHEVLMLRMSDNAAYDLRKDSRSPLLALLEEFEQWLAPNLSVDTI